MRTFWLLAEDRSRRVSRQHQNAFVPQQPSIESETNSLNRQSSTSSIDSETCLLTEEQELEKLVEEGIIDATPSSPTKPIDPAMIKIKYKNVKSQVDERQENQPKKDKKHYSATIVNRFRRLSSQTPHSQTPSTSPSTSSPEGNGGAVWAKQTSHTVPNLRNLLETNEEFIVWCSPPPRTVCSTRAKSLV